MFSLLVGISCQAMEDKAEAMIAIKCSDGEVIAISEKIALQASIIKNYLGDAESPATISTNFEEMEQHIDIDF